MVLKYIFCFHFILMIKPYTGILKSQDMNTVEPCRLVTKSKGWIILL